MAPRHIFLIPLSGSLFRSLSSFLSERNENPLVGRRDFSCVYSIPETKNYHGSAGYPRGCMITANAYICTYERDFVLFEIRAPRIAGSRRDLANSIENCSPPREWMEIVHYAAREGSPGFPLSAELVARANWTQKPHETIRYFVFEFSVI